MKAISFVAAALAALPLSVQALAPFITDDSADVIPNSYIVVMKNDVSEADFQSHLSRADSILRTNSVVRKHTYSFDGFRGYNVEVPQGVASLLAEDDQIAYIEANRVIRIEEEESVEQSNEARDVALESRQTQYPWNIRRIFNRANNGPQPNIPATSGSGTYVYVVDTGVEISHPLFGGRASHGYNAVGGTNDDTNGHGTHVAGIAGARGYTATPAANIISVKVFADGSGSTATVINGIDWTVNNIVSTSRQTRNAVILAIGGTYSAAMNNAVRAGSDRGAFFAVAAGGSNQDAGQTSPGSEPTACVAGGTTISDARASSSNYGPNVDIFAPGTDIQSAWLGGQVRSISGTSASAAHVASGGAYFRALGVAGSSVELCEYLRARATRGVLSSVPSGTSNLLLYLGA